MKYPTKLEGEYRRDLLDSQYQISDKIIKMKEQLESIKHLVRPHIEQAPKKRKSKKPE